HHKVVRHTSQVIPHSLLSQYLQCRQYYLIERLNNIDGIEDIGLTTNGVLLGKYAEPLYDAGLRRLNLSLDALDAFVFGEMNGRSEERRVGKECRSKCV